MGMTTQVRAADLAIVIDDVGYSEVRGMRTINLPGQITVAVLPFAPHTSQLVKYAIAAGKDVIIHQPMEPYPSPSVREENGTLKLAMGNNEFDTLVANALDAVPQRTGVSNHTGSLLTSHREPMTRLMSQLSSRGLYFLDSRTTAATVALDVAKKMGVPAVRRDVFLDHTRTPQAIEKAFVASIRLARRKGHAVLVGHPYPMTLDFLERALRGLPSDIRLVTAAELATTQPTIAANFANTASHQAKLDPRQYPGSPHISLGQ